MTQAATVRRLMEEYGRTYADDAGITLADKPSPLYRLLVLTQLLSARIDAGIAVDAARCLSRAGYRTPRRMRASTWQQRVDVLGEAHYRRYDESTATYLDQGAQLLLERYRGDLRRLRAAAGGSTQRLGKLLQEFPRIGPTGADIFRREVQAVWPDVRPFFDARARQAAARLKLPTGSAALAQLVAPEETARLAAALVRRDLAN